MFAGILFVLDHDTEGIKAQQEIHGYGFKPDINSITLNPRNHPESCAKNQVVIEDLLSLNIQQDFFDAGAATCSVEYENGRLVRYKWGTLSKPALRDFACGNGGLDDFRGIVGVLRRVRSVFGLP
jgi:hypothetical protein